jgi:hypothetical protein
MRGRGEYARSMDHVTCWRAVYSVSSVSSTALGWD